MSTTRKLIVTFIILFQLFTNISTNTNTTQTPETQTPPKDSSNKNATVIKEPEIYSKVMAIKIKHIKILHRLLNETDAATFVYFYTKTSKNAEIGAEMLKMVSDKLDFLVHVILVDCEDFEPHDYKYCVKVPEAKDGFPRMVIYEQPKYRRNPYTGERQYFTEHMYSNKVVEEATIYNFVTTFINNKSVRLNPENIENFLNNNHFNKVILFTEREETSILYKGISSFFYDQLLFGEIHKDNKALIKRFKIKTFPTLIVYVTQEDNMMLDEPRIERYGASIHSRAITHFIGEYAMKKKMYLSLEQGEKSELEELKYKVSMKDLVPENYVQYLTKFISKRFIIYLDGDNELKLEDEKDKEEKEQADPNRPPVFKEIPTDLKKLSKNTNGFFLFVRFNCNENKDFCKKTFNVDTFPSLLLVHKTVSKDDGTQTNDIPERLKRPIRLSLDYETMETEILNEFPTKINEMNSQNIGNFLQTAHKDKITPFIYLHEGVIPIGLQLLSHEDLYRKYVQINEIKRPNKDLLKNFQVKKVPSAIFLIKAKDGQTKDE